MFLTMQSQCELFSWTSSVDTSGTWVFLEASSLQWRDLSDCSKAASFPLKISLSICLNCRRFSFFFYTSAFPLLLLGPAVHLCLILSVTVFLPVSLIFT